jgi:hypothetical protein
LGVFALARRFIPAGTKLKRQDYSRKPGNRWFFRDLLDFAGNIWISPELLDFPGQGM